MSDSANRRQSYRLDDTMKIRLRVPDQSSLDAILLDFNAFRLRHSLKSNLRNQSELRLPKLQVIRKRDPDVAQYLEHLESQIVQLAERFTDDTEMELDTVTVQTSVNISATGIRLKTPIELEPEQLVELNMLLSTSAVQVMVLARVVRIELLKPKKSDDTPQWEASMDFSHIHADDVEAIIRHMAKLQQIQLQARRAG